MQAKAMKNVRGKNHPQ
jgi:hypothetical protein